MVPNQLKQKRFIQLREDVTQPCSKVIRIGSKDSGEIRDEATTFNWVYVVGWKDRSAAAAA
jgi:hypothetical protein